MQLQVQVQLQLQSLGTVLLCFPATHTVGVKDVTCTNISSDVNMLLRLPTN